VPAGVAADPTARPPLLVVLHGSSESGPGTNASLGDLFAAGIARMIQTGAWPDSRPFVVLFPQHAATPAAPCFTSTEIDRFIRYAIGAYGIDSSRVYLTGYSCGAIGIWNYLGAHTDQLVTAVVPIAGDGRDAYKAAGCRLGLVPIWAFAGDQDTVVDPDGSIEPMHELSSCSTPKAADVRLTIYPGVGHDAWDRTYDGSAGNDIYSWLLTEARP